MTISFSDPPVGGEIGVLRENILELRTLYNQFDMQKVEDKVGKKTLAVVYYRLGQVEREIEDKIDQASQGAVAISASHEKLRSKVDSNWKRHRATVKGLEAAIEQLAERVAALEAATVPVKRDTVWTRLTAWARQILSKARVRKVRAGGQA